MTRKTLIYIVSDIDKSLHFEWIIPHLKDNFHLSFILIGKSESELEKFLMSSDVPVFAIPYSRKWEMPVVWARVLNILIRQRPDIVHTHLWIANVVGLAASWIAGVRKRIYTRHHAMIHYKEYPAGLKWDKLNNKLATHIIAISRNVENILLNLDNAARKKVRLVHHGFLFSYFENVSRERTIAMFKKHHINPEHGPVVGVISRFLELKGIKYVIIAFAKLRRAYPNAHLVLANAHGNHASVVNLFLSKIPEGSFTAIKFENDLAALYSLFDIFVHVPIDEDSEAFGQTYVEPLIAGVPAIFTLSGVAPEFVEHRKNAVVVPYKDAEQIYGAMLDILNDEQLRRSLVENGKRSVAQFTIENYLENIKRLYLEE